MRLALVTETFPPDVNGVAMTLRRLVGGLAELGHAVQVVRPRPRKSAPKVDAPCAFAEVMGLPLPGYPDLQFGRPAWGWLRKHWKQQRPDLVHIATEGPLGLSALWAARSLELPITSSYHTNFHSYGRHYGYGFIQRQVLGYFRYFHNVTARTFVPSEDVREMLKAQGLEHLALMGRGVDTQLFSPERRQAQLREQWGAAPEDPVVLYVGRIASEKNIPLTVEAFQAFREKLPNAKMVIVGDGPERQRLQTLHPEFHFAGMRQGEDLAAHYASADLFFFASETETFGNVTTEAMASGLVVLAYDYAAARRYLRHGENGFLAPLGQPEAFLQQTATIATAQTAWPAIRREARATAETLSWGKIVAALESEMRQVIDEHTSKVTTM